MEMKEVIKEALEKGADVSKDFFEKAGELAKDLSEKGRAGLELLQLEKEYKETAASLGLYAHSLLLTGDSAVLSREDETVKKLTDNLRALEKDLEIRRTRLSQ